MESLELRIFKEVAVAQSISKAAKNLGYVQSNVTHRIRQLENEINCELFIRTNKGVTLTEEGVNLLTYANRITDLLDNAMNNVNTQNRNLKIGALQTIASKKIPFLIKNFVGNIENIDISIRSYSQSKLIDLLLNKKIDCAFINTDGIYHKHIKSHFSFKERYVIISSKDLAEIRPPKIIVSSSLKCPYRKKLFHWYKEKFRLDPEYIEFDTLNGLLESVSLGIGISLIPLSILPSANNYHFWEFKGKDFVTIDLITNIENTNPDIIEFVNYMTSEHKNTVKCSELSENSLIV